MIDSVLSIPRHPVSREPLSRVAMIGRELKWGPKSGSGPSADLRDATEDGEVAPIQTGQRNLTFRAGIGGRASFLAQSFGNFLAATNLTAF